MEKHKHGSLFSDMMNVQLKQSNGPHYGIVTSIFFSSVLLSSLSSSALPL